MMNWSRIIRWIWTIGFAFTPIIMACMALWFARSLQAESLHTRPDVIFAALVLGASAWRDLSAPQLPFRDITIQLVVLGCALITIFSAGVFGIQTYILSVGATEEASLRRIFNISSILALVAVVGTTILQYLIARGEATSNER